LPAQSDATGTQSIEMRAACGYLNSVTRAGEAGGNCSTDRTGSDDRYAHESTLRGNIRCAAQTQKLARVLDWYDVTGADSRAANARKNRARYCERDQASRVTTSGIVLVDKPDGHTSHDVVARVRRAAGTRKVGHAGTLDPMATGLLILGIESSTRLLTFMVGLDKRYEATIRLGESTTTDDAEGDPVASVDATGLDRAVIDREIARLTGEISQVPSSVSAIKVDGRRAYDRVRSGEDVVLTPRSVTVSAFEVLRSRPGVVYDLDVVIDCSSGTYVRALARDLGAALGVGGHLTALRRTRIGPFEVGDAAQLEGIDIEQVRLRPAAAASSLFPVVSLTDIQAIELAQGKRPVVDAADVPTAAAVAGDGRLVGLVTIAGGIAKTIVNFPTDEVA
jgi:tRNA pseudouridine55 synthase